MEEKQQDKSPSDNSATVQSNETEAVVESIIFASDRPVKIAEIAILLGASAEKDTVKNAIQSLQAKYSEEAGAGILLKETGGGWQFRTNPRFADYIHKFYQKKPRRISNAAMEVLSIIAYRQPATSGEIEEIRGVDSSGVLRALLDRKLVRIIGHKEEPGRPLLYATTSQFLEFVGINSLSQLPTLEEFLELSEEHRAIVEKEIPEKDENKKQNIISELIARQFAKTGEKTDSEGTDALKDLDDAIKNMETTFKKVADSVGLKVTEEAQPESPQQTDDQSTTLSQDHPAETESEENTEIEEEKE
ncbi:MAG: SMC-Scp complex subunit ScpB [Phycisphaerae bacterium]|nr:SMC-Scp complex subunit ScpB [Phycisphaerae bacterium]